MEDTYDYLLEESGFQGAVNQFVEEYAEFTTALMHLRKTDDYIKVHDEMSDLLITLDRLMHALDCHNEVSEWKIKNMLELKEKYKEKVKQWKTTTST